MTRFFHHVELVSIFVPPHSSASVLFPPSHPRTSLSILSLIHKSQSSLVSQSLIK